MVLLVLVLQLVLLVVVVAVVAVLLLLLGRGERSYQACSAVDSAVVAIGHLFSFDMEHKAPFVLNRSQWLQKLTARWMFVLGNVQSTYQPRLWDFMYIDALHESHLTEWWLHNVRKPLVDALPVDCPAIPVHIHDAFVPYFVPDPISRQARYSVQ